MVIRIDQSSLDEGVMLYLDRCVRALDRAAAARGALTIDLSQCGEGAVSTYHVSIGLTLDAEPNRERLDIEASGRNAQAALRDAFARAFTALGVHTVV